MNAPVCDLPLPCDCDEQILAAIELCKSWYDDGTCSIAVFELAMQNAGKLKEVNKWCLENCKLADDATFVRREWLRKVLDASKLVRRLPNHNVHWKLREEHAAFYKGGVQFSGVI